MTLYSYIEERYCLRCKKNVGVEYTQMNNGELVKRCLNRSCCAPPLSDQDSDRYCFFHTA